MATFTQSGNTPQAVAIFVFEAGVGVDTGVFPNQTQPFTANDRPTGAGNLAQFGTNKPTMVVGTFGGEWVEKASAGFDWFEAFHVVPRSFSFGNLLTAQSVAIEVFSAFRHAVETWVDFIPNAGSGIELGSAPSLPTLVDPLTGFEMTLDVSAVGDAFVDGYLDFDFGPDGTIRVPVEIQRIVLLALVPELPFVETIEALGTVYESIDGTETRDTVREIPRRGWEYVYIIEEGAEAQKNENIFFDFQARTFGVPEWQDDTVVTSAVSPGDTTINVESTEFRALYVGGLFAIFSDQETYDVIEISAITSTTIELVAGTTNGYAAGSVGYPLATCTVDQAITGERWPYNLQKLNVRFEATNNNRDFADLSAFSSYDSRLFLDEGNALEFGTFKHSFISDIKRQDGQVGKVTTSTLWNGSKRRHDFTLRAEGREAVWNLRALVYALRGRSVAFYVPRSSTDLVPDSALVVSSAFLNVQSFGYAQYVRARSPKARIRIRFNNGDPDLIRNVLSAEVISSTIDRLTLDDVWPDDYAVEDVETIEYVERVRLDTNKVAINFDGSGNRARMTVPILTLFE